MNEREYLEKQASAINAICAKVLNTIVVSENFEDAAAIRDARDQLKQSIEAAIDNLLPSQ